MKHTRTPVPAWLNEHLLAVDMKTILKVATIIITAAILYYAAVYELIGAMPVI